MVLTGYGTDATTSINEAPVVMTTPPEMPEGMPRGVPPGMGPGMMPAGMAAPTKAGE